MGVNSSVKLEKASIAKFVEGVERSMHNFWKGVTQGRSQWEAGGRPLGDHLSEILLSRRNRKDINP